MRFVPFQDKINLASIILMLVSLFGFIGNVMIDFNWGTNVITNSFAIIYWMTLRWMIPFPVDYWGLGAVVYFTFFLFSFAVLNRKEPFKENLIQTVRLASVILVFFEIGVCYFVPDFFYKWVINAVRDTPLSTFTNADLLAAAIGLAVASQLSLIRTKRGSVGAKPTA